MASSNPQNVSLLGRLSWPIWDHKTAVTRNQSSQFPQPPENVTAEFNLLVEQPMLDKLIAHVKDEFLPFVAKRHADGEAKNALDPAQIAKLLKQLDAGDWDAQPPYIPIKPVPEKTMDLAPEAVAMIKVKGPRQADIEQRAIVQDEGELSVPDPDMIKFPAVLPIHRTVHTMYGGCNVAVILNLYSFVSGKLPGYSASAGICVFHSDNDRFGGGAYALDEDEIFML